MSAVRMAIRNGLEIFLKNTMLYAKIPHLIVFVFFVLGINKLRRIEIIAEWIVPQFGIIKKCIDTHIGRYSDLLCNKEHNAD